MTTTELYERSDSLDNKLECEDMKAKGCLKASIAMLIVLIIGLLLTVQSIDFSQFRLELTSHYRLGFYFVLISIPFLSYFAFGFASLNRNGTKQLKDMPTDPAKLGFWEGYISQIGKTGKTLRYWMKCILLGWILWASVGVSSVLSNTLISDTAGVTKGFISDYYFLTLSIVTGCTSLLAIRALRGLGDKLEDSSKHLKGHSCEESKETKSVADLVEEEKSSKWLGQSKRFWYCAASLVFALTGGIVGIVTAAGNPSHWYGFGHLISSVPFVICCGFIGFTVGTLVFISARGIAILKRYCRECVLPKDIFASSPYKLNSQKVDEPCDLSLDRLKKIGHFSFELNLAAAIPSFAFFMSYLSGTKVDGPASLICLTAYTVILICISILPLLPFHTKMATAKEDALEIVNREFRATYSKYQAGDRELVSKLRDLFDFHERIDKMPAWPLDRWIDSKLLVTIPLPVVLGVLSTFVSKLLGM
jgi:hypothetical protein